MKLTTTTLWQVVALIGAAANQYLSVVPDKYKPFLSAVAAIVVILLHLHAGNHDQQGNLISPAPADSAALPVQAPVQVPVVTAVAQVAEDVKK